MLWNGIIDSVLCDTSCQRALKDSTFLEAFKSTARSPSIRDLILLHLLHMSRWVFKSSRVESPQHWYTQRYERSIIPALARRYAKLNHPTRTCTIKCIPITFTDYLETGFHSGTIRPRLWDRLKWPISLLFVAAGLVVIAVTTADTASRTWLGVSACRSVQSHFQLPDSTPIFVWASVKLRSSFYCFSICDSSGSQLGISSHESMS